MRQNNTQNILNFVGFTHKFNQIQRVIYATGEDRNENDSEHSFQLALLAWYIISTNNLNYDIDKVIKYALVHDLVEIYAGDTFFHTTDKELKNSKSRREQEALSKIKIEFSEFKELSNLIQLYEEKSDKESKFVYALDKMLPVLNIYLDGGKSWKRDNVSYQMIRSKDEKIKMSEDVTKMWLDFVKLLDAEKENLFPKK